MTIPAILTFRSYKVDKVKKGMLFYVVGEDTPYIHEVTKTVPKSEQAEFLKIMGSPVLPYLVAPEGKAYTLAKPEEIGWINDKEITVEDFNLILKEFDGKVSIEIENNKEIFKFNNKVVITVPIPTSIYDLLDAEI